MSQPVSSDALPRQVRRTLIESPEITAVDFRCVAEIEPEGREEANPTHSIVFVRRGVFGRTHRGATLLADPNYVLFFNSGQPYRYSHPLPGGDECTILAVASQVAADLVAGFEPRDAERPEIPFRLGHGLCSKRAAWLHYEFLALACASAPMLATEDILSELAQEALRCAYETDGFSGRGRRTSPAAERRQDEMCESVKAAVNRQIESLPSLRELAESVACSPFHLSRTFRERNGISLRRYVARLRGSMAAERLIRGTRDLTELALDLGFADHSHFTNSFRKEWGIPPSRFRARLSARRL